jgi:hypothetical protein
VTLTYRTLPPSLGSQDHYTSHFDPLWMSQSLIYSPGLRTKRSSIGSWPWKRPTLPSMVKDYLWATLNSGRVVQGYVHGVLRCPDPCFNSSATPDWNSILVLSSRHQSPVVHRPSPVAHSIAHYSITHPLPPPQLPLMSTIKGM